MTKTKFCGITRTGDIETVNKLKPDYIGFVFAEKSKRHISYANALKLKKQLYPYIKAVGVFVNCDIETVLSAVDKGIIDLIQLHGTEDEAYIKNLRQKTDAPIIQAFVINSCYDIEQAEKSSADYILLDGGRGEGKTFDTNLLKEIDRPYFLAGGLNTENVSAAVKKLNPYAVDVSSGIETEGKKDKEKMTAFISAVRGN